MDDLHSQFASAHQCSKVSALQRQETLQLPFAHSVIEFTCTYRLKKYVHKLPQIMDI